MLVYQRVTCLKKVFVFFVQEWLCLNTYRKKNTKFGGLSSSFLWNLWTREWFGGANPGGNKRRLVASVFAPSSTNHRLPSTPSVLMATGWGLEEREATRPASKFTCSCVVVVVVVVVLIFGGGFQKWGPPKSSIDGYSIINHPFIWSSRTLPTVQRCSPACEYLVGDAWNHNKAWVPNCGTRGPFQIIAAWSWLIPTTDLVLFCCLRYVDKVQPCKWPAGASRETRWCWYMFVLRAPLVEYINCINLGTKAVLPGAVHLGLQMDV